MTSFSLLWRRLPALHRCTKSLYMKDLSELFRGKRVTVMGLGLLGRGVGDAAYLAEMAAEVIVTDLKSEAELAESVAQLKEFTNITFVLGEHRLEDFKNRDFILKAAGVPMDSPYIAEARKNGIPVRMSAAMFSKLSNVPMIGITGTRGKSTVTHMIYHVLSTTTEDTGTGGVILGGNVRGVSNLQLLKEVGVDSLAVFELDSWQLQGFGEEEISPQIAVFTNFMQDHANYYHNDTEAYFKDKAQIFLHQNSKDSFVTTPQVLEVANAYAKKHGLTFGGEVLLTDVSILPEDLHLSMPGEHNRLNAALAIEALRAVSLPDELIFAGLSTFRGVPGRLELLREHKGIRIYNDNNATTPEATIEGLKAVSEGKNVVLIMGGADKGLGLEGLEKEIARHAKEVIMIPGTGTDRALSVLPHAKITQDLDEALTLAVSHSENGDVVLFSPAFASFGQFKNEYERNDVFVDIVSKLESL